MENVHKMEPQQDADYSHHIHHILGLQERSGSQPHCKENGQLHTESHDEDQCEQKRLPRGHFFVHASDKSDQQRDHDNDTGIQRGQAPPTNDPPAASQMLPDETHC